MAAMQDMESRMAEECAAKVGSMRAAAASCAAAAAQEASAAASEEQLTTCRQQAARDLAEGQCQARTAAAELAALRVQFRQYQVPSISTSNQCHNSPSLASTGEPPH